MPETVWIADAMAGDAAAFAHIVERYQRPVFALAFRMLGQREDAADATQETFLRAYGRLHCYDPQRPLATWLLSIAAHHCLDMLRRKRSPTVDIAAALQQGDWQLGPEDTVLAAERKAAVRAMVERLAPAYRLVVVLRYWHELSYEEIAQIAGLSLPTVKTRLHRAKALLVRAVNPKVEGLSQGGHENALSRSAAPAAAAPR